MNINADDRPSAKDIWNDPWLQNNNLTCESSFEFKSTDIHRKTNN